MCLEMFSEVCGKSAGSFQNIIKIWLSILQVFLELIESTLFFFCYMTAVE